MKVKSRITDAEYEAEKCVFLKNHIQAGLYLKNNLELVDCFWDIDRICYVFYRIESYPFYDLWCKHELK